MSPKEWATDYVDVATRVAEFRAKHPDGALQPANLAEPYQILELSGSTFIVVVAAAYRTPDDPRPGVGMAYEAWPGRTPYTKGSELQNAETSAWGRAIMAALAADARKGIASADEVRNRATEEPVPEPAVTTIDMADMFARVDAAETVDALRALWEEATNHRRGRRLSEEDYPAVTDYVKARHEQLAEDPEPTRNPAADTDVAEETLI